MVFITKYGSLMLTNIAPNICWTSVKSSLLQGVTLMEPSLVSIFISITALLLSRENLNMIFLYQLLYWMVWLSKSSLIKQMDSEFRYFIAMIFIIERGFSSKIRKLHSNGWNYWSSIKEYRSNNSMKLVERLELENFLLSMMQSRTVLANNSL